ncbi:MAG: hypothetical protein OEY23_26315, partial [Acidimicrobiia bacterium]|nr:hypothetical protein [Acidimicrobiia bacterium]
MSRIGRRALAIALGLGLVAAACGGSGSDTVDEASGGLIDDDIGKSIDEQQSEDTATAASGDEAADAGDDEVAEPTSMDEWEELWAEERAAIVKRIEDNGWGLQADGKTVLGPEGFEIDLSKCPADWNNTEGLTDTEIKLGSTAPASGTQATGVYINQAMSTIFDYYGDKGMFTDSLGKNRRVNQLIKDDGYDPARTIPLIDELIDSDKV